MPGNVSYASYEEMLARFGRLELLQVTDLGEAPLADPDADVVTAALADSSETVNGYVAGRYALPLSPVPDPVRRWTCDIARYFLHRDTAPERVRKAYEDALAALKDVSRGVITLQADGLSTPEAAVSGGHVQTAGPDRMFTAGGLKGF